jgi:RP/EB family microtubule-associated protein
MKRFWDANYPGTPYDPVARRRGDVLEAPATMAPVRTSGSAGAGAGPVRGKTPVGGARRPASTTSSAQVNALHEQVAEMRAQMEGLEKERDFYFQKVGCDVSRLWNGH